MLLLSFNYFFYLSTHHATCLINYNQCRIASESMQVKRLMTLPEKMLIFHALHFLTVFAAQVALLFNAQKFGLHFYFCIALSVLVVVRFY